MTDVTLHPLLTGELGRAEAIESGRVHLKGKRKPFERFLKLFHIRPIPAGVPSGS